MKIGLFVDPFATSDTSQEDEYEEIENAFRKAYPGEELVFKRDMQPYNLKNNPVDIYLFDFGGLSYSDYSGGARRSFASTIVEQLKDLPNTLFIPYSKMTRDYVHDAMDEFFPGIQAHNLILPANSDGDKDWLFNPIEEVTTKWKNTLTGVGSPVSTFFEPDSSFFPWFVEYLQGRPVIEIGCGNCRMIRRMHLHNIKAMGVDPVFDIKNHPDLRNACINQTGQECRAIRTNQKMVVLFCRPCHSGFVQETCEQVGPNAEIIYISLPKNVEVDFEPPWVATEIPNVPGLTGGEKVYTVKKSGLMPPNGE